MISKHVTNRSALWLLLLLVGACQSDESRLQSALRSETDADLVSFIAESQDTQLKEQASFALAQRQKNVAAYLRYLHHYPQGKFATQATQRIDSLGMVLVEGGHFVMGCDTCNDDERPAHPVELRNFYIDKTEVTLAQFRTFIAATGYKTDAEREGSSNVFANNEWNRVPNVNWRHDVAGKERPATDDNHPVVHVSWFDAREYAKWCGKRLPTEAEWEYAARGGKHTKGYLYAGSNTPDEIAWYTGNTKFATHPVGQKKPNELGLYDMSGNVYEWCNDWFEKDYYAKSEAQNPSGPQTGTIVALRGGGWNYDPEGLRPSNRINAYPLHWYGGIGFRCVADPTPDLQYGLPPQK